MKMLVLGGTRFFGVHLVNALQRESCLEKPSASSCCRR